jgi:hypothetical protein
MSFSSDDRYLLLYNQIVDNFQIRQNENREGTYLVWDNQVGQSVKNWEGKETTFKKIQFPNHIYGKYQVLEGNLADLKRQDKNYVK